MEELKSLDIVKRVAILANEKTFLCKTLSTKYTSDFLVYDSSSVGINNMCISLLLAEMSKFLREEKGLYVIPIPTVTMDWTYKILKVWPINYELDECAMIEIPPYKDVCGFDYNSYDLALVAGLEEAFKLVNIKK